MLLVHADLHREGLVFPPFAFGERTRPSLDQNPCLPAGRAGEIETEGLGIMALAMGHHPGPRRDIEILHAELGLQSLREKSGASTNRPR